MLANCGSNRAAAWLSSERAISTTSVAENIEIKQTATAFFNSIVTLLEPNGFVYYSTQLASCCFPRNDQVKPPVVRHTLLGG